MASSVAAAPGINVTFGSETARLRAELVSGNYFRALGVRAQLGRVFSEEDDRDLGAHPVVVLSDEGWRQSDVTA